MNDDQNITLNICEHTSLLNGEWAIQICFWQRFSQLFMTIIIGIYSGGQQTIALEENLTDIVRIC